MAGLGAVVASHTVIRRRVFKDQGSAVGRDSGVLLGGRWQAR